LVASDDAAGQPLWGQLQPEEDRDGRFAVCYHAFVGHDLPGAFYLGRASQFVTARHGDLKARHDPDREPTHFARAMSQPKVGLTFASNSQAHSPRRGKKGVPLAPPAAV
jgi:hypothetical protein